MPEAFRETAQQLGEHIEAEVSKLDVREAIQHCQTQIEDFMESARTMMDEGEQSAETAKEVVRALWDMLSEKGQEVFKTASESFSQNLEQLIGPTTEQEFLELTQNMSAEELRSFLTETGEKSPELTPAQEIRMEQLSLISTLLRAYANEIRNQKTWATYFASMFGAKGNPEAMEAAADKASGLALKIAENPTLTLNELIPGALKIFNRPSDMLSTMGYLPIIAFGEIQSKDQLCKVKAQVMDALTVASTHFLKQLVSKD